MAPDLTLYFLGASRAIRIAWLLEELDIPYNLVASPRASTGLAPPEFKAKIPTALGKSPTIQDGDIVVQESSAIVEYLCETYDPHQRLLPSPPKPRAKVREFIAAAEGTFGVHALAILYARWRLPEPARSDGTTLEKMEAALSTNVQKDLDWLEFELEQSQSGGKYLVGDNLTSADIMVAFSIQFIFARELGTKGLENEGKWQKVRKWLEGTEKEPGYVKAVEKTGFKL